MKNNLFLVAVAVTLSFAVMSCTGNKTANASTDGEETVVATVETVAESNPCCQANDSCCQAKDSCTATCNKNADCAEKKECCNKK